MEIYLWSQIHINTSVFLCEILPCVLVIIYMSICLIAISIYMTIWCTCNYMQFCDFIRYVIHAIACSFAISTDIMSYMQLHAVLQSQQILCHTCNCKQFCNLNRYNIHVITCSFALSITQYCRKQDFETYYTLTVNRTKNWMSTILFLLHGIECVGVIM